MSSSTSFRTVFISIDFDPGKSGCAPGPGHQGAGGQYGGGGTLQGGARPPPAQKGHEYNAGRIIPS